jgi:hypothetical protein
MDVAATAKISAAGIKMIPSVARWYMERRRRKQDITYAKELLGIDQSSLFSYRVAMDHPLQQQGTPHVDDLSAFADIASPSIVYAWPRGWTEYLEDIEADLNEGMVLIGSPEAEALTRLLFGYRKLPGHLGVEYLGGVIDLPYRWQEDTRYISAQCQRFVRGRGLVSRPNWPIIDNSGSAPKSVYPIVTNDGFLDSDFLLITRVPNFLTSRAQQSGRFIVSVAGVHGVGTRAIGLALRSRKVLTEIAAQIDQGTEAFQILLEARSIVHDPARGSFAKSIAVRNIRSFSCSDDEWSCARRKIQERYTDWASELVYSRRMELPVNEQPGDWT